MFCKYLLIDSTDQFSILGDYGYSHDVYDFTTLCGMNIGYEQFSNTPIQQSSPFLGINHIASKDFARKMVEEQEKCLKEEIVKNRKAQIAHRQVKYL